MERTARLIRSLRCSEPATASDSGLPRAVWAAPLRRVRWPPQGVNRRTAPARCERHANHRLNQTAMKVRAATCDDLPAILEIYNEAVLNTTASYDYEPRTLEHRVAWFEDHAKQNYPVFVAANSEGRVIGWSSLSRYHDRPGYRFTVENSVYVAADQRGRGVGKMLMKPLVDAARERGLRAIIAAIDAANEPSIRLHAAFGFERAGHFREVGFKFGRWLDVVYMQLLLPPGAAASGAR